MKKIFLLTILQLTILMATEYIFQRDSLTPKDSTSAIESNKVFSYTYYVTQSGTGDQSGSSLNNAMSVATHNKTTFLPDTKVILSGIITSEIKVISSGDTTGHIVYNGNDRQSPAVNIQRPETKSGYIGIKGESVSYLTFQNIEISKGGEGIQMMYESHHINFYNNNIHDLLLVGIRLYSTTVDGIHDIVIGGSPENGNRVYNIGTGTGGGDISIVKSVNTVISHNILSADIGTGAITDRGIDGLVLFYNHDMLIEYNEIDNHSAKYYADVTMPKVKYTNGGVSQAGSITAGDTVYIRILGSATAALGHYYTSKYNNGSFNTNTEDYTNTENWTDLGEGNVGLEGRGEDGIDLKNYNYDITIRYNKFRGNDQTGVTAQMGSHDIEIYGNYFSRNNWAGVAVYSGAGVEGSTGRPFEPGYNVDIHHNIFFQNRGNGVQNTCANSHNVDTNNNVFVRNGVSPYGKTDTAIQYFQGKNHTIMNNIFYNNRPTKLGSDRYNINLAGGYDAATSKLKNNLYYDSTQESKSRWGVSPSVVLSTVSEPDLIQSEPLFVNPDNDFHLQSGSTAIGAGTTPPTTYSTDYEGAQISAPYNIGAY